MAEHRKEDLVVVQHRNHLGAVDRVLLHQRAFFSRESSRLLEDLGRHVELPDIVELRRPAHGLYLARRQP
jgi:hypothetical protein